MNRLGLYFGIIVCFLLVTTGSFLFGKFVLGDRVLNKPNIPVMHLPGDSPATAASSDREDRLARSPAGPATRAPSVVIEVKPEPADAIEQDPSTANRGREPASPSRPASPYREAPSARDHQPDLARSSDLSETTVPAEVRDRTSGRTTRTLPPPAGATVNGGRAAARGHERARTVLTDPPLPRTRPVGEPEEPRTAPAPSNGKAGTHRVQVGLFDGKENAEARASELQRLGHQVSMTSEEHDGRRVYRVQVGPFKSREEAVKVKGNLASQGFEGFVPQ